MRESLFRGKRLSGGKWVEGSLLQVTLDGETWWLIFGDDFIRSGTGISAMQHAAVDPNTIGQFTGMTDKNGKKIFEGDILKFSYTGENKGVEGMETVVFKNGKFGVEWGWHRELVALDGFANTTMAVIGNIHDNPELVEESV